jgi:hypothetical protein
MSDKKNYILYKMYVILLAPTLDNDVSSPFLVQLESKCLLKNKQKTISYKKIYL